MGSKPGDLTITEWGNFMAGFTSHFSWNGLEIESGFDGAKSLKFSSGSIIFCGCFLRECIDNSEAV
jgi:hypothetical protein